jgi:hypothetical protein
MGLAPFFDRVWGALGGHLAVSRESLTSALTGVTVGICVGRESHGNDEWIASLSTNLLARLYPRIALSGPAARVVALTKLARSINPNIEVVSAAPACHCIAVGAKPVDGAIHAGASGWVARIHHAQSPPPGPENPYSAGVAACLACAELFRRVFLNAPPGVDVAISLLDFKKTAGANLTIPSTVLGNVLFVGVGAVGNAAMWALSRDARVRGLLRVVDPESVELSNLQRYLLALHTDLGTPKVNLAERALIGTQLVVEPYKKSLEEFAEGSATDRTPTTVVSVDNVDGRRAAQALLPRLVINGWTGGEALGTSWHMFSRESACLACLYHPHGQGLSAIDQAAKIFGLPLERAAVLWVSRQPMTEADVHSAATALGVGDSTLKPWLGRAIGELYTDVACGAVPIDLAGVGKLETVPLAHQSALAGILMAAELIKRTNKRLAVLAQPEVLVSWDNILGPPPAIWAKPRARERGCICGDADYQEVYRQKWQKTTRRRGVTSGRRG